MLHCEQFIEDDADPISDWVFHITFDDGSLEGDYHALTKPDTRYGVDIGLW